VTYSLSRLKYVDDRNLRQLRNRIDHFGRLILRVIVDDNDLPLERASNLLRCQGSEASSRSAARLYVGTTALSSVVMSSWIHAEMETKLYEIAGRRAQRTSCG
jgi:hypothetical protein